MGVRSFLIKFNNIDEIKNFYIYRKYIAYIISNEKNIKYIDDEKKLNKFMNSVDFKASYGDFDLDLVGFKVWAGAIWGLVSTYSAGQETFQVYTNKFKNYATRLWYIPSNKVKYDEIEGVFMSNYDDCEEACNIFTRLRDQNSDVLLNYADIFAKYPEFYDTDCDNCINFANGEMYGLFNIQLK